MLTHLLAVAAETPSPSPAPTRYIDPQTVTPGLLGLVIFVALAVATVFLWRSMNKQLKKIDFDEEPTGEEQARAEQGGEEQHRGDAAQGASSEVRGAAAQAPEEPPVDLRDKS